MFRCLCPSRKIPQAHAAIAREVVPLRPAGQGLGGAPECLSGGGPASPDARYLTVRSGGYLRRVGAVHADRPAAVKARSWTRWLLFAAAAGWLLLGATIAFVPKPRRPADGAPTWKLVLWLILFFLGVLLVAFIWKGGENQMLRRRG